jgi:glc operon protein GlcG
MRMLFLSSLAAATLLLGAGASAQQPAAPAAPAAPAGVPDAMPFDIPYGTPITVESAAKAVAAAVAEAKKGARNWKLAIAVVDPNGDLVYFYRMDGTQVGSVGVAQGKARTAARFRRASDVFAGLMQTPAGAFVPTLDSTIVASLGG